MGASLDTGPVQISEHIERLVNLLKGEEGSETIDVGSVNKEYAVGHRDDLDSGDEDYGIEEM